MYYAHTHIQMLQNGAHFGIYAGICPDLRYLFVTLISLSFRECLRNMIFISQTAYFMSCTDISSTPGDLPFLRSFTAIEHKIYLNDHFSSISGCKSNVNISHLICSPQVTAVYLSIIN